MGNKKKKEQLGMNHSTARSRLVKNLLFEFIRDAGIKCLRCGGDMTIDDFTIDHIEPWLDSDDPVGLYFDTGNIAYSHHPCNAGASRQPNKLWMTDEERKARDARRKAEWWRSKSPEERKRYRSEKYRQTGH